VIFLAPTLYYPPSEASSEMPWMLSKPTLMVDHRIGERWAVNAEGGVVLVTCLDTIASAFRSEPHSEDGHHLQEDLDEAGFGGVFHTLGGGISYHANSKTDVFLRAAVVMRGLQFADEYPGVPLISTLGVTRRF
jgi:hypothetical protein